MRISEEQIKEILKQLEIAKGLAEFYSDKNDDFEEFYKGKVEAIEDVLSILEIDY